ncbi:MAG: ATP-binding cassette domain-containing protein [Paracoccaceae bacterium]|nr:ATP-binding cassette domain-containing protein [Paracoccaceae bacterium]
MIELDSVKMSFGDRTLFQDVTLLLPEGSFHFLTGPSGAGKTTLLRLCSLQLRANHGRVRLLGQDTRGLDRDAIASFRRRIGVVHQDSRFVDHLTVAENVTLPLAVSGRSSDDPGDLSELMGWVGLGGVADRYPPELSGGERQRAALARAVILSPEIVLADEPTGNVDWEMSLKLLDLLIELNRLGKTVLCATHDLNLIRQAKSRIPARVLRIRDQGVSAGAEL